MPYETMSEGMHGNEGGEMMGNEPTGMPAEGPEPSQDEENTVSLDAAMFPQGVDLKDGTKLTFCVTSPPDSEGKVSGYFEGGNDSGKSGTSWEEDFRNEMSPQNPSAQPQ